MSSSSSSRINSSKGSSINGGNGGSASGSSAGASSAGATTGSKPPLPAAVPQPRGPAVASAGGSRPLLAGASNARSSTKSIVRENSIRFRHDEPEWYEDSSFSGDSGTGSTAGMEVMDLRPSAHHAVRHMETSSLVSLGSGSSGNSTIESSRSATHGQAGGNKAAKGAELAELKFTKMPPGLFNVASGGSSKGGNIKIDVNVDRVGNPNGGDGVPGAAGGGLVPVEGTTNRPSSPPRGDMPTHWEEAEGGGGGGHHSGSDRNNGNSSSSSGANHRRRHSSHGHGQRRPAVARKQSSLSLRISNNGKFLLGESEQAYRALMSLMGGTADEDNRADRRVPASGSVGSHSRSTSGGGSEMEEEDGSDEGSGFWSEMGDATTGLGSHASGSGDGSNLTETSPLTRERRRQARRRMYVRRCARAMAGFVALAALSVSAIYFISEDGRVVLDLDVHFLGKIFETHDDGEKEEAEGLVGEELREQIDMRKLPEGGNGAELTATGDNKGQTSDRRKLPAQHFITPYHKNDAAYYDERMPPREREFMMPDQGHHQDHDAPQDVLIDESWYNPNHNQDQREYNRFPDQGYQDNFAPQGWN